MSFGDGPRRLDSTGAPDRPGRRPYRGHMHEIVSESHIMSENYRVYVVAFFTISICLAASELLLRFFLPQNTLDRMQSATPAMFRKSDLLAYELVPSSKGKLRREEFDTTITINSSGYRGRELHTDKRGRFRIMVVGDSFTLGWGVEDDETYPAQMERILANEYHKEGIEVINAGFAAGYSPDTYYLFLKERGLQLHPDLVLIGFFVGNDIDHRGAFEHQWIKTDQEGLPLQIKNVEGEVENGRWVRQHKRLSYRIPILRNSHLFHLILSSGKGFIRVFKSDAARRVEFVNPFMYEKTYAERTEAAVKRTQTLFRAMARLAAKEKISLAVIMIPAREQVYSDELPSAFNRNRDWEKPQRIFKEFFKKEQMLYLDLLPIMKAESKGTDFYFRYDMHWNAKGHEFGGRTISAYLVENDFLRRL